MVKLSAPQSYQVVKYLLEHPNTTQRRISVETGVSLGLVNYIVSPLFDKGICRRGKWKRIEVVDPLRFLEMLSWERSLQKLVKSTIRLQLSQVSDAEIKIHEVCRNNGINYALTTFSALNLYRPYYITYPIIHIYASEIDRLEKLLPSGRGAVAIDLLEPDFNTIMKDVVVVQNLTLVSPIQTVIDLFCFGEGGRDGAMKLLDYIRTQKVEIYKVDKQVTT